METKTKQLIMVGLSAGAVFVGGMLSVSKYIGNEFEALEQETQELIKKTQNDYQITNETICFPRENFQNKFGIYGCFRLADMNNTGKYDSLMRIRNGSYSDGLVGATEFNGNKISKIYSSANDIKYGMKKYNLKYDDFPQYIKVDQNLIDDVASLTSKKGNLAYRLNKVELEMARSR